MFGRPFPPSVRGIVGWARLGRAFTPLFFFGVVIFLSSGAAVAADFQENVALRDAHTRVWEATRHQVFVHPITGQPTSLEVDVPSQIVEKGTDINYRTPEGAWERTDTTIQPAGPSPTVAGAVLAAVRQRAKIHFSPIGEESFNISYSVDGETIRTGVRALALLIPETGQRHIIGVAQVSRPVADGNRAVYTNVFPGCDIVYVNDNVTFKQNLVLREDFTLPDPARCGINPASAMLVIVTEIDISGTDRAVVAKTREGEVNMRTAALADASLLEFRNARGNAVSRFTPGFAWVGQVSRPAIAGGIPVWKRFEWTAGKLLLLEGLRYLAVTELQRPIVIDYLQRSGTQGKNEVWDRDKTWWITAPYYLEGCELVIDPGTVVKLGSSDGDNDERIIVQEGATVKAIGEPYLPIFITAWSDDGYGDDTDGGSETTPTRGSGNYAAAFHFESVDNNTSEIQFCRIRWAKDGIVNDRSELVNEVRDNIFRECQTAVRVLTRYYEDPVVGVDPQMKLENNLIYDGDYGVAVKSDDEESSTEQYVTFDLTQNTIADMEYSAVQVESVVGYNVGLTMYARNNILASCSKGYDDADAIYITFSGVEANGTGFADLEEDEYEQPYTYTGAFAYFAMMSSDPDYQATPPFDADHQANGKYYLDQQNDFVNAGYGSLATYGITGMTTKAPTEYDCGDAHDNESPYAWDKATTDVNAVDLGYHHPRVDYIVGVGATLNDRVCEFDTDVEVAAGVVVAFFRPEWQGSGGVPTNPFFSGLQFNKNEQAQINAKLMCNHDIPDGQTVRYARDDMIRFDSSYYLGTNFFDYKRRDADPDGVYYGPFAEADGIVLKGDYSHIQATLLRHLHTALYFEECLMEYREPHLRGLTFERGDVGIATKNLPYTGERDVELGNVHSMYSAFLDLSDAAFRVTTTSQAAYAHIVTMHNHTFLNCGKVAYMNCAQPGAGNTQLWSGINCVVGCGHGITGNPSNKSYQVVFPSVDAVPPENGGSGIDTDGYWNNGLTSNTDVDHSAVTTYNTSELPYMIEEVWPRHVNPLLVSLPSAVEARDWYGLYLSQRSGDVSRIPLRMHHVDANPFISVSGWPSGDYRVFLYPAQQIGSLTLPKASTRIYNGNIDQNYSSVAPSDLGQGDLLVRVECYEEGSGGADPCYLDFRLANGSDIRIYFNATVLAAMQVYQSDDDTIALWVGIDGSTFYAGSDHAPVPYATGDIVTQNARYAMSHDQVAGGVFQSANENNDNKSPVLDVFTGQPRVSTNGTTSTAIPYVLDQNQDENGNYRIDAGFHYWGWNYTFPEE